MYAFSLNQHSRLGHNNNNMGYGKALVSNLCVCSLYLGERLYLGRRVGGLYAFSSKIKALRLCTRSAWINTAD